MTARGRPSSKDGKGSKKRTAAPRSNSDRKAGPGRTEARARSDESAPLCEPFWSNPFRLLGLPADASGTEIKRRIEQARIEARLSSNPIAESDIDALVRAQAALLDPSKRIHHEVLWFYDPPECVQQGTVENVDALLAQLRERAEQGGDDQWRSRHDLALALLIEASLDRDSKSTEEWTIRALSAWREVARDPNYLRRLAADNRLSAGAAADTVWAVGLDILSAATLRSINAGDMDGVLSRYRGARACGVEEEELLRMMEPTIEAAVLDVQRKLTEAKAESERMASSPRAARRWAKTLVDGVSIYRDLHDELREIGMRQLQKALDEAASLIRGVAITLHNEHSESEAATKLLEAALDVAASPKLVERLESDHQTLSDTIKPLAERDAAYLERLVEPLFSRYEAASLLAEATSADSALKPVSIEALPLACEVCGVSDESVKRSVLVYTFGLVLISWRLPRVITMCASHRTTAGILAVAENFLLGLWGLWAILWTLQFIWSNASGGRRDELTNLRHLTVLALEAARDADHKRLADVLSEIRATDPAVDEYISGLLTGLRSIQG
jgi:hypothetical protein